MLEYDRLQRRTLDAVAVQMHKNRPSSIIINDAKFMDFELYPAALVRSVLRLKPNALEEMIKTNQVYAQNSNVPGYEVHRINRRIKAFQDVEWEKVKDILYVPENCIEDMVRAEILQVDRFLVDSKSLRKAISYMFPVMRSEQYDYVQNLLNEGKPLEIKPAKSPRPKPQRPQPLVKPLEENTYVDARKFPFAAQRDYLMIPDSPIQDPDVLNIRYKTEEVNRLLKKAPIKIVHLHPKDVERFWLAMHYNTMDELKRQILHKTHTFDASKVWEAMEVSGMQPVVRGSTVYYAPGLASMVALSKNELSATAARAKPLIEKRGSFVKLDSVGDVFDESVITRAASNPDGIAIIRVAGKNYYNLFQLMQAYG